MIITSSIFLLPDSIPIAHRAELDVERRRVSISLQLPPNGLKTQNLNSHPDTIIFTNLIQFMPTHHADSNVLHFH